MKSWKKLTAVVIAMTMVLSVTTARLTFVNADTETGTEYTAYSDKDSSSTETDYGIYTAADWLAAVSDSAGVSGAFSGVTLHLMNDIDMENTAMNPLAYGGTFTGTLDGHGYVFKNINITETITGATPVGLVSQIAVGGAIQNVGIESGSITVTYSNSSSDGYGIGAIAGNGPSSNSSDTELASVINCWNAASVYVNDSAGKNPSVSGMVARGAVYIDGCYNIGSVQSTGNRAAGIIAWGQKYSKIYNSFNYGTITATSETYVFRYSSGCGSYSNLYEAGTIKYYTTGETSSTAYVLSEDTYSSGELAYLLNTNYTELSGVQTYYTLEDGKTVFGTYENQVVKVEVTTVTTTGSSSTTTEYVPAGTVYSLSENASYEVTEGTATIEDGKFTVPTQDVAVTVTIAGLSTTELEAAVALYDGKNTAYFADSEALAALLASVSEKLSNLESGSGDTYTTQSAIDADAETLISYYVYGDAPNLPSVTETDDYPDAPGYVINNVGELEYVGKNHSKYESDKTIYLAADLDLTDSSFDGILNLYSDFDGMEHTISNYAGTDAFIGIFYGASFANLTMTDSSITPSNTTTSYCAAAIMRRYSKTCTVENVTVENTTVYKYEGGGQNCAAIIVGMVTSAGSNPITVKDCVVRDCTIDVTGNGKAVVNVGMIMGNVTVAGSLFDGNLSINNTIVTPYTGTIANGLYLGEISLSGTVTITNSAVWGGSFDTADSGAFSSGGALVGSFKNASLYLNISNVIVCGVDSADNTDNIAGVYNTYNTVTVSNTYYDSSAVVGATKGTDAIDESTVVQKDTDGILSGEALYELNSVNGDYADWAVVKEDTEVFTGTNMLICFADEDNAAPVKVTFTATDNSDNQMGFEEVYYTDNTGVMIGDDIETVINAADWGDDTLTATKVFTEDTDYVSINDIGAEVCYVSLSLAGDIGINFYVRLSDAVISSSTAYMQFTVEDEVQTVYVKDVLSSATKIGGETYYVFTCNVNAIQMTVPVTAQLFVDDENRSLAVEYSVVEYAEAVINDESMSETTVAVVKALVNYGGYAQIRFNSEYDPAYNILDESDRELADFTIDSDAYVSGSSGTLDGITYYGSTLALDSCTAIRMYFVLDDGNSIDDYTFAAAGTQLVPAENRGMYYVDIEDVTTYELGNMYTVTVTEADGSGSDAITINYSVMSYIKNMVGRDTTSENEKNILKALYWLYVGAVDFYNEYYGN